MLSSFENLTVVDSIQDHIPKKNNTVNTNVDNRTGNDVDIDTIENYENSNYTNNNSSNSNSNSSNVKNGPNINNVNKKKIKDRKSRKINCSSSGINTNKSKNNNSNDNSKYNSDTKFKDKDIKNNIINKNHTNNKKNINSYGKEKDSNLKSKNNKEKTMIPAEKKTVRFDSMVFVHETYIGTDYQRGYQGKRERVKSSKEKHKIVKKILEFKILEMYVHPNSVEYTNLHDYEYRKMHWARKLGLLNLVYKLESMQRNLEEMSESETEQYDNFAAHLDLLAECIDREKLEIHNERLQSCVENLMPQANI